MKQLAVCLTTLGMTMALTTKCALAQNSVTLYGLADTSLRFVTNADAQGRNRVFMTNGAVTGSRWGLKGSEDLGDGLSALFRLENGFNVQDGTFSSPGTEFNRMAYVGLSNARYGSLTFGLQNTPLFDQLGDVYDPLTVGNYNQTEWMPVSLGAGLRNSNSVKYNGKFGGLNIEGMYAFGGVPGSVGAGSMYGFTAAYAMGALSLDVGYQQNSDQSNNKQKVVNVSALYSIGKVNTYLGWLHSQDNTGKVDFLMFATGDVSNYAPTIQTRTNTNRIDDGFYAGANWQVSAPLTLTAAVYYDRMRNALSSNGTLERGNRYAVAAVAEYALSKRTEVYAELDYNHASGAATVDIPHSSSQTGASIGLRTSF